MKNKEKINFLLIGFFLSFFFKIEATMSLVFVYIAYKYIKDRKLNFREIFMMILGILLMVSVFK
jgi:hypothetical protein